MGGGRGAHRATFVKTVHQLSSNDCQNCVCGFIKENQSVQNPPTERHETNTNSHSHKQPNYGQSRERLTKDEENNLADYLNLGMSIREARAAFQTEVEAAELRHKVRENQRAQQRGSIKSTGRNQWGASTSTASRGRGGLSFNWRQKWLKSLPGTCAWAWVIKKTLCTTH